jgi:hypothetical protein
MLEKAERELKKRIRIKIRLCRFVAAEPRCHKKARVPWLGRKRYTSIRKRREENGV